MFQKRNNANTSHCRNLSRSMHKHPFPYRKTHS